MQGTTTARDHAEQGYLGGGATGYRKVHLEANLTLTEMCRTAVEIGAATPLPPPERMIAAEDIAQ